MDRTWWDEAYPYSFSRHHLAALYKSQVLLHTGTYILLYNVSTQCNTVCCGLVWLSKLHSLKDFCLLPFLLSSPFLFFFPFFLPLSLFSSPFTISISISSRHVSPRRIICPVYYSSLSLFISSPSRMHFLHLYAFLVLWSLPILIVLIFVIFYFSTLFFLLIKRILIKSRNIFFE